MKYDFSGWATKNNLKCSDGRVIMRDAFKDDDGRKVPLVWNHQHERPDDVLGHAYLKNEKDGVRFYGIFNDTESGVISKALVKHGDIVAVSIFANHLQQEGPADDRHVKHGEICEVSLVHKGANPGAFIDEVLMHNDELEAAIIYTGEPLDLEHTDLDEDDGEVIEHAEKEEKKGPEEKEEKKEPEEKEEKKDGKTVKDVFDTLNEEQKTVVYGLIGAAVEDAKDNKKKDSDEEEEKTEMKHNVFEMDNETNDEVLTHADMQAIFADAKRCGSLREAVNNALEGGVLAHSINTTGMTVPSSSTQMVDANGNAYGFNDPAMLFPEFKSLNNPPEWIKRDMDWVSKVMSSVHHTPFSRIKSVFANITEDEARAKGYIKGNMKKEEVFTTLKRTTSPQTIYKKQKLDRDDIIDITDFDVVAWIRAEMRVMLNEEIARAILIGDGRLASSDDKIQELNVRPVVTDVPLFNTKVQVSVAQAADEETVAKATINAIIRARKNYKGSGNPTFYTTEDVLTEMLLIEDGIGHKLYKTEAELATALRVKEIVTVEPMENMTVDSKPLIGAIVNLADYNVGADKGGEINMFDDFDIDYNQQKYLIETRISGALIKPYSALTILLNRANG